MYEEPSEQGRDPFKDDPWEESLPEGLKKVYTWREIGRLFAQGTLIVIAIFSGVFLVTALLGWFGPTP